MGKFCEVCAKGRMSGHNVSHSERKSNRTWAPNVVSHSERKSNRTWAPNVQKVRVVVDGRPMRLNVCTRCLRSGYVQRAATQSVVTEEA